MLVLSENILNPNVKVEQSKRWVDKHPQTNAEIAGWSCSVRLGISCSSRRGDWDCSPITGASKDPTCPHFHHNEPRLQLWLLSGMSEYIAVVTLCQAFTFCWRPLSSLFTPYKWTPMEELPVFTLKNTFHAQSRLGLETAFCFIQRRNQCT